MRIFLAIIVWVLFIGGLTLYMKHRGPADFSPHQMHEFKKVEKMYTLEITPSFMIESDPFALTFDSRNSSPAILVRLGEYEILKVEEPSLTADTFKVEISQNLFFGENEIYIEASPPSDQVLTQNALRVRIIENGYPVAEKTIWSPPGAKLAGTFHFTLKPEAQKYSEEKDANE